MLLGCGAALTFNLDQGSGGIPLAQPADGSADPSLTDLIGYFTGVVTACLVWSLHTTIHKGIIQMWRYTKGTDSSAIEQ